jgi:serine/threonine protein kinase
MLFSFVTTRSSYVPTEVIGHGATSSVVLVKDPKGRGTVAVKRFHRHIYESIFMAEIEILVKLNHPCILRLLKSTLPTQACQAAIQMEWAEYGSLARVLQLVQSGQPPPFWNSTGISIIISGIVLGMRFMHSRGYIHQDLNPSNILVSGEGGALISDFGSSRSESTGITPTSSGADQYGAPEICYEDDWTRQVDVYSFGLILYEVLVDSPVFGEKEGPDDLIDKKLTGYVPEMGSQVSYVMSLIIQSCLEVEPGIRPSFDDILKMFQEFDFCMLPGTDIRTVWNYVRAVTDWELSPH